MFFRAEEARFFGCRMNKCKLIGMVGCICLGLPKLGLAQEGPSAKPEKPKTTITLNLSECIQRALATWPSMEVANEDVAIVEGKVAEASNAYFLPHLKLQVFGGPVPDVPAGSAAPNFPTVNTNLSDLGPFVQAKVEAVQPLYTFGKLSNLKRAAKAGLRAKKSQVTQVRHELIDQVKRLYHGAVFLKSLKGLMEEVEERSNAAQSRVNELVKQHSPEVTDIDRMRLEVFLAELDRRLIEVRMGERLARKSLGILTGGLQGPEVDVADRGLRFKSVEIGFIEHYLARAKVARPELVQLDDALEIREALMKVSQADYFPMFFLGGFYHFGYAPGRQDVENPFLVDEFNFNSGGATLGMEQNLSFHLTDARYRQQKAEYRKMVAQRKLAKLAIELEIRKAHSEAVAKHDSVKSARKGFKAARSWVTASTLNFGVGLVPVKDLLEAFVSYTTVKVNYFDTIFEYDVALSKLSRAVGEEVAELTY